MNGKEYREYQESVHDFFDKEGITNLSIQNIDDEGEQEKPSFSWSYCDVCGTSLGGDRYTCNGYHPATKTVLSDYEVCSDCYYYAEYGKLDDQTMWEIEKSEKELDYYKAHPSAWPGGYYVVAIMADGGMMCHGCICNEPEVFQDDALNDSDEWRYVGSKVYWEGLTEECAHCGKALESEYGDPDTEVPPA